MKNFPFVLFFVFIALSPTFAQNQFGFEFDYSTFNYDSTSVYMECYYSFDQTDLNLLRTENQYLVQGVIHLKLTDKNNGELFIDKEWKIENSFNDSLDHKSGKNLVGVFGIVVPEGNYNMEITGTDMLNKTNSKTLKSEVTFESYSLNSIAISEIELAQNILKDNADPNSIFYKNTLEVIPNPSTVYTENSPVMFYYVEIYNLSQDKGKSKYGINKYLTDSNNRRVYEKNKILKNENSSTLEVGTINLSNFPTGAYTFRISVIDSLNQYLVFNEKRIFVYNPSVEILEAPTIVGREYLSSEYGILADDDCDDMFDKSKYLASRIEKEQYEKLSTLESKRKFLYEFWTRRDVIPETPTNELKNEYFQRIEEANYKYSGRFKDGYKSDRGRVFAIYGEPDQVDDYPDIKNKKPYVRWFYGAIEGGVEFIFADLTGFRDYQLLHSTKNGEMQDPNWASRITILADDNSFSDDL